MYGQNCNQRTLSREYDCLVKIGTKEAFTLLWETRSNVKGQHAPTRIDNQRQNTKKKKTHLLLRILAVIGRYGPHLMIVMIFVTQNNF